MILQVLPKLFYKAASLLVHSHLSLKGLTSSSQHLRNHFRWERKMSIITYIHLWHFPFNFSSLFQMKWKGRSPLFAWLWRTVIGAVFPHLTEKFWDVFLIFCRPLGPPFFFFFLFFFLERPGHVVNCKFIAILIFVVNWAINWDLVLDLMVQLNSSKTKSYS